MKQKKKILITVLSVCLAAVIALVVTVLAVTVWKPKKKLQEWLNDFSSSVKILQDESERKIEKSITIYEDETEVVHYKQLLEIKNQEGVNVAHFYVSEEYPSLDTREFDLCDEYYLIDGVMYMQRVTEAETVGTSFSSSFDVFWEVVNENIGSVTYDFSESNFSDYSLTHKDGIHSFKADVYNQFFVGAKDVADMSGTNISITINDNLELVEFAILYTYRNGQTVEIRMKNYQPAEIEIKDFAK